MIVQYHEHRTGSNDDFSYWKSTDHTLDLDRGTVTTKTEDSGWESNSGPYENIVTVNGYINPLSWQEQNAVYTTLAPIIDTAVKYPHLKTFRFFNFKHRKLIEGRLSKAITIASHSDYHGIKYLRHIFILPNYGKIVTVYIPSDYGSNSFSVTIEPIYYESAYAEYESTLL